MLNPQIIALVLDLCAPSKNPSVFREHAPGIPGAPFFLNSGLRGTLKKNSIFKDIVQKGGREVYPISKN